MSMTIATDSGRVRVEPGLWFECPIMARKLEHGMRSISGPHRRTVKKCVDVIAAGWVLPRERCAALVAASHTDPAAGQAAAWLPNGWLTAEEVDHLVRSPYLEVQEAVARSHSLTAEQATYLFDGVQGLAEGRPAAFTDTHWQAVSSVCREVRHALAGQAALTPEQVEALLTDLSTGVRSDSASRSEVTPERRAQVAAGIRADIRAATMWR